LGRPSTGNPQGSSATSLGARRSEEAGSSREIFSPSPQSIEDSHRHQSSGREQRPGLIKVCHKISNRINHRDNVGPVAPIGWRLIAGKVVVSARQAPGTVTGHRGEGDIWQARPTGRWKHQTFKTTPTQELSNNPVSGVDRLLNLRNQVAHSKEKNRLMR